MKFKIIFSLIFVAALCVMTYFAYLIVKERYFDGKSDKQNNTETDENSITTESLNIESGNSEKQNGENNAVNSHVSNEEIKNTTDEKGISANITAEDCDNECANFKEDTSNLKYCQDICDISPIKDSENCGEKQGIDKDYCYKNQAVAKTDLNICDSIFDSKIKKLCKNRVTEDLLEKQL